MGHGRYIEPPTASYVLGAGESLELSFSVMPGESKDIDISVDLAGEGASFDLKGYYILGEQEKVNIRVRVHHKAPRCRSSQTVNGVAGGNAEVSFDGRIIVAPGADGTDASQTNRNVLVSDSARVGTTPQLEIYADDVKCSHGATVGKLNEEELFYMRTRGIPEREAKVLQLVSFLSPALPGGENGAQEAEAALRRIMV